jgi:glycosyltransferase involved in cell wall biosynthesis
MVGYGSRACTMPRISAIIPAFNGASRYLDRAIGSVLAQTYRDRELIVVDDGSTDETGRLVLRFPQARYFRRAENGGQAAARNDGARLAGGEFLAFLDQDDLWEPLFLAEALSALEKAPDAALVHADGYQVNESNEVLEYDAAMKHHASITQILRGGHDVATSGSLLRRACFEAVGGYDATLPVWEDIDLAIRLYRRYPLLHLPKPLYRHRVYGHNVSRKIPSERALLGRRRFLDKHAPACSPGSPEARALRGDWARYFADLGKHERRAGRTAEARMAFYQALRHDPWSVKGILRLLRSLLNLA